MSATSERTGIVPVAAAIACAVLIATVPVGCGPRAIPRFDLAGTVTYHGKPVPRGYIVFRPDRAAGRDGPGAQADIRDGRFATLPGQGTIGGRHVIQVFGFDGKPYDIPAGMPGGPTLTNPMGMPLFSAATLSADLPEAAAVRDFIVPTRNP